MSTNAVHISFITPSDLARFEGIFKQNVPSLQQRIDGPSARKVLVQSSLASSTLASVWDLADITGQGSLSYPEFALAMFLTHTALSGKPLPSTLPNNVRQEILAANQQIQQSSSQFHEASLHNALVPVAPSQPQPVGPAGNMYGNVGGGGGVAMGSSLGAQPYMASPHVVGNQSVGPMGQVGGGATGTMTNALPNYGMPSSNAIGPGTVSAGIPAKDDASHWVITTQERQRYNATFRQWDKSGSGYISGQDAKDVFSQSGLPQRDLMRVWQLADYQNHGKLNQDEFAVAMHLIFKKLAGVDIPADLPDTLVPKSTRDLSDSISAIKGSILTDAVSRKNNASTGSQPLSHSFLLESDPVLASAYSSLGASEFAAQPSRSTSSGLSGGTNSYPRRKKDEDDTPVYVSKSRYKSRFNAQNPPKALTATDLENLRKKIREKKYVLDALREKVRNQEKDALDLAAGSKVSELKNKLRKLNEALLAHGDGVAIAAHRDLITKELCRTVDERSKLQRDLQDLVYLLPTRLSEARTLASQLEEKQKEAIRRGDQSATSVGADAVSSKPLSREDAISQRAAALLAERMQKVTGKSYSGSKAASPSMGSPGPTASAAPSNAGELAAIERQRAEVEERIVSIEKSVRQWRDYIAQQERQQRLDSKSMAWPDSQEMNRLAKDYQQEMDHRDKWETGTGVQSQEVKFFVEELAEQLAKVKPTSSSSVEELLRSTTSKPGATREDTASLDHPSTSASPWQRESTISSANVSYSSPQLSEARSPKEREQLLHEAAEKRVQERTRMIREKFAQKTEAASPASTKSVDFSSPVRPVHSSPRQRAEIAGASPRSPLGITPEQTSELVSSATKSWSLASDHDTVSQATRQARDAIFEQSRDSQSGAGSSPATVADQITTDTKKSHWSPAVAAPATTTASVSELSSYETAASTPDNKSPGTSNMLNIQTPAIQETPVHPAVDLQDGPLISMEDTQASSATPATSQPAWHQAFSNSLEKDWDESDSSGFTSSDDEEVPQQPTASLPVEGASEGGFEQTVDHTTPPPRSADGKRADASYGQPYVPDVPETPYTEEYDSDSSIAREGGLSALLAHMITNKIKAMEAHDSMDSAPPPPLPSYQQAAATEEEKVSPAVEVEDHDESAVTVEASSVAENEPEAASTQDSNPFARLVSTATLPTDGSATGETSGDNVEATPHAPAAADTGSTAFDDIFSVAEPVTATTTTVDSSGSHNPFAKHMAASSDESSLAKPSIAPPGNEVDSEWQMVSAEGGMGDRPDATDIDVNQPTVRYSAIYKFEGSNSDDLVFTVGEIILVPESTHWEEAWWYGWYERDPSKRGYFPNMYVQQAGDRGSTQSQKAHVIYAYTAQHDDELSVTANEEVTVLDSSDPNWWRVENEQKQAGIVPSAYVMVDDAEPAEPGAAQPEPTK
ncbi:actin organization and endocytosis protein [Dispira parvispora]|uniref:Actin organization and endocytosis protein n=1 Tax=Dispira parvispora TaxID=1520584 RepID=A0A9W8AQE7_9FUNG|nr:actin organization and endocytosis protein [Dispira parvispora]